jgi:hypothetical protein
VREGSLELQASNFFAEVTYTWKMEQFEPACYELSSRRNVENRI